MLLYVGKIQFPTVFAAVMSAKYTLHHKKTLKNLFECMINKKKSIKIILS